MNVMVTGASGRIGRYVVDELQAAGHSVLAFDQVPHAGSRADRQVSGDVLEVGDVAAVLSGVEVIVHLASIPAPGFHPDHTVYRNNVVGAYAVHEAARLQQVRRVVSTSSTAVYGWAYRTRDFVPRYLPVDEEHPCLPQDPYGIAKLCLEHVAAGFTARIGMETVALRPGRVLLPDDIEALRREGGMPAARFDLYQYIDARDLAAAYRRAVEADLEGHHVLKVVASDSTIEGALAELLPRLLPEVGDLAAGLEYPASGVSNRRAREVLGWQPVHSWRD